MSSEQLEDLQDSLKQVIALLKNIYYEVNDDKENLEENGKELALLKSCFEDSLAKTCTAGALLKQIKKTADENLFLVSTMSKLEVNGDEKNKTDHWELAHLYRLKCFISTYLFELRALFDKICTVFLYIVNLNM